MYAKRIRNSLLIERDDIIQRRRQHLRSIKKYREEGRKEKIIQMKNGLILEI